MAKAGTHEEENKIVLDSKSKYKNTHKFILI
jgi:hypothetical protein